MSARYMNPYSYCSNNPIKYNDPTGLESGYVIDNDGAGGFGHAGMFVQTEDGKYAFFEANGISEDSNGLSSGSQPMSSDKDAFGNETTVLSNSPLEMPSPEMAEDAGMPGQSGVLMREFDSRDEMFSALAEMGFDEALVFDTNKTQDSAIYQSAMSSGINFGGYNLLSNSCGIYARNALTTEGSGLRPMDPFFVINTLGSQSILNTIGANLMLANKNSKVFKIGR
jgi:hypothetical protein